MLSKDLRQRPQDVLAPLTHFVMLSKALEPPAPTASRLVGSDPRKGKSLILGPLRLNFQVGDIATAAADAIVSSGNFEMRMRTGVGEALRVRGGDEIEEEAMAGGEQPLGTCIRTNPGRLSTRHVFHAVSAWNEVSCVGRAFARALLLAEEHGCASLAAPALGTGVARVELEACANAMMTTLRWHTSLGGTRLREITIFLNSEAKRRVFQDVAQEVLGIIESRHLGLPDLGLPDERARADGDSATCLDPHQSSS
jgi:serine/threonine-protein kinase